MLCDICGTSQEEPMSDDPPHGRSFASDQPPEFGLSVVSPRHCVVCNACRARFGRVGATCESCGADHALVGVAIRPLSATDELFRPRSAAMDRRVMHGFSVAFWRLARIRQ
jgi:hypothetical protein